MKRNDVFPSKWLSASDLNGPCRSIIMRVGDEKLGDDTKRVVFFSRAQQDIVKKKGLVLNATNWDTIATLHGEDDDDWVGCEITIYPTTTMFGGKATPCIRVDNRPRQLTEEKPAFKSGLPTAGNGAPQIKPKMAFDDRNPPPDDKIPDDMNDEVPF